MDFITVINTEWNFASLKENQWQNLATGQPQWGALGSRAFPTPADIISQPEASDLITLIWTCMLLVSRDAWMQKAPWWLPLMLDTTKLEVLKRHFRYLLQAPQQCEETFCLNLSTLTWHYPFSMQIFLNETISDSQSSTKTINFFLEL